MEITFDKFIRPLFSFVIFCLSIASEEGLLSLLQHYTVKPAYNETARGRKFFFGGRFRFIQVFEIWILGTGKVSAKDRFPLCTGPVQDRFMCVIEW
jgi:hypothetical protein